MIPLRCFGLACTGFARDDNALILLVCVHVVVSTFGDGKDVWCHLETVLASIGLEDVFGVDTEIAERVDRDEYIADVGIDFCILETLLEILVDSFVVTLDMPGHIRDTSLCLFEAFSPIALATPPLDAPPPDLAGGGLEAAPAFLAPAFFEMAMMEEVVTRCLTD